MTNPFDTEDGRFDLLVNDEGQYSLWPSPLRTPAGWNQVLRESDRLTCLFHVRSAWTDLRPRSLVSAMKSAGGQTSGKSLRELFQEQVAQHRNEIAVVGGTGHLTYAELDRRSDELALALLDLGVERETRVGLLLDRSLDLVVAIMAVVKAGGVYVPLPIDAPLARLELMHGRIRFPILMVDELTRAHPLAGGLGSSGVQVVRVDQPANAPGGTLPVIHPDQLAYIIHTSGSTGAPKGAAISHRSVATFATDQVWRDDSQRAVLMAAPPVFDGIIYEMWVPLLRGGRVVVAPPGALGMSEFAGFIARSGATSALLIPYVFNSLAENFLESLGGLELIWTGGDTVSGAVLERVSNRFPHMRLAAAWGTTETTMISSWHPVDAPYRAHGSVPIGQAMDHTRIHVLDESLRPVPAGETGEAYVAGIGPARGYEASPDLTAERFVADPHGPPGSRMYRTGDLLRTHGHGNDLEFVGRADRMVKVRGYRIEPGEVEAGLARDPAITQVTVVAPLDGTAARYLLAFVVPAAGILVSEQDLRAAAEKILPEYMVPAKFVFRDALPLTRNGKVDRKALLESLQPAS